MRTQTPQTTATDRQPGGARVVPAAIAATGLSLSVGADGVLSISGAAGCRRLAPANER